LSIQAIVLANFCVALIMLTQNQEAEEVMKRVEQEEDRQQNPNKNVYH